MTLLQRRHRAVYRVYGEDEYLAGADPFADWNAGPAAEPRHRRSEPKQGHSLQRVAGVVALTGAVGTVGVTVGLGLRSHPGARRIAVAAVASPARGAPSIGGGSPVRVASPVRGTPRREAVRRIGARRDGGHRGDTHRAPARGGSTRVARGAQRAPRAGADVAAMTPGARVAAETAPTPAGQPEQATDIPVASTPQETSIAVASTAQDTPTETVPAAGAQSEFGFER